MTRKKTNKLTLRLAPSGTFAAPSAFRLTPAQSTQSSPGLLQDLGVLTFQFQAKDLLGGLLFLGGNRHSIGGRLYVQNKQRVVNDNCMHK